MAPYSYASTFLPRSDIIRSSETIHSIVAYSVKCKYDIALLSTVEYIYVMHGYKIDAKSISGYLYAFPRLNKATNNSLKMRPCIQ